MKTLQSILFLLFTVGFVSVYSQTITPLNQIAFGLLNQQPDSYPYTFVVIGDTRENYDVENDVQGDYSSMMSVVFLDILQELENLNPKPDFIINLGDAVLGNITNNNGNNNDNTYTQQYPAYYHYISEFMDATGIPFFTIPGNHEFWVDWNGDLFSEYIGNLYDVVDYGNTRLIWSNNGMNDTGNGWENYWFTGDDLDFVSDKLSETNSPPLVFTACHVPMYVADGLTQTYQTNSFLNYYNLLKNNNITANFSAHQHNYQRFLYCNDGVNDIVSGGGGAELHSVSNGEPPSELVDYHFLIVSVSENNRAKVQMYIHDQGQSSLASEYDFIIPVESSQWIHNETVPANKTYFYSAYNQMNVAGNNTSFVTENNSNTEITAGRIIRIQKGVHIQSGSKFHAYISDFTCNIPPDFTLNNKNMLLSDNNNTEIKVNKKTNIKSGIKIYPNPNNGQFFVKAPENNQNYNIKIYNVLGKTVFSKQNILNDNVPVNISDEPNGIYFVKIEMNGKIFTQKIIKE